MAHGSATKARARLLYLEEYSTGEILAQTGISRATLQRWKSEGEWERVLERQRALEVEAGELVVELARAARRSGDPQQAYAAMHAADLARLRDRPDPHPEPRLVAEALLRVMMQDDELAPLIRKKREKVLADMKAELQRIQEGR
ncbi:MAG TPA: hypothetical protein VF615_25625 [Longimicrobiaceae bacterium]